MSITHFECLRTVKVTFVFINTVTSSLMRGMHCTQRVHPNNQLSLSHTHENQRHPTQRKMDVEVATMNRLAVKRLVAAKVDAARETVA